MNAGAGSSDRNPAQAVLEEILWRALDEATALRAHRHLSDEQRGALMAYLEILECGKQRAEALGLRFQDPELQNLDPQRLLPSSNDWE
jgi:hypothetical protein